MSGAALLAAAAFACGPMRFVDQPDRTSNASVREMVDVLEPDRVPPIDFPALDRASEAIEAHGRADGVIVVEGSGNPRAYPLRILVWHEVVNDVFGDVPIAVTYSPLSDSVVVFDRRVGRRTLTFGTSGKLLRASLVLYDRETVSLWPQPTGTAAAGALEGLALERLPFFVTSLGAFADAFPEGEVVKEPAFLPGYERTPYPGYASRAGPSRSFFLREPDRRLPAMRRVIGVAEPGRLVAYPVDEVARAGALEDGDRTLWLTSEARSVLDATEIGRAETAGTVAVYRRSVNGRALSFTRTAEGMFTDAETGSTWDPFGRAVDGPLTDHVLNKVDSTPMLWFAWAAFNPSTLVFGVG